MGGINYDAEIEKLYKDPQQKVSRLYCGRCGEFIRTGQAYYKFYDEPICKGCLDERYTFEA